MDELFQGGRHGQWGLRRRRHRKGWNGDSSETDQITALEAAAQQRTAEAGGAEPAYAPYVPELGDTTAPSDLQEAADYYLTPRGQHPNAPNKMLQASLSYMVAFHGSTWPRRS